MASSTRTAVTAYSLVLLNQAGYSTITQGGLADGLNTIGVVDTIISATTLNKLGRRSCLKGGWAALFADNLIAASCMKAPIMAPNLPATSRRRHSSCLFFTLCYAVTWGSVALLIPTEIFPSEMRAGGNGFGITGWAIGVGSTVLVNPIMFAHLQSRTYFLFIGLSLPLIPIIHLFYHETADRSLESIDALFSTSSPFFWNVEKAYAAKGDMLVTKGARRRLSASTASFQWRGTFMVTCQWGLCILFIKWLLVEESVFGGGVGPFPTFGI